MGCKDGNSLMVVYVTSEGGRRVVVGCCYITSHPLTTPHLLPPSLWRWTNNNPIFNPIENTADMKDSDWKRGITFWPKEAWEWWSDSVCVCGRLVPDGQQFVQQISSSSEQSSSGQIQRLPPPRVRAQSWHCPTVVLQWVGNNIPIKRELPIEAQHPGREARVLPQINHRRPRPGEADPPVHDLGLRLLSASLWLLEASSADASLEPKAAVIGRRGSKLWSRHCKHLARVLMSPQRGRHHPQPTRSSTSCALTFLRQGKRW